MLGHELSGTGIGFFHFVDVVVAVDSTRPFCVDIELALDLDPPTQPAISLLWNVAVSGLCLVGQQILKMFLPYFFVVLIGEFPYHTQKTQDLDAIETICGNGVFCRRSLRAVAIQPDIVGECLEISWRIIIIIVVVIVVVFAFETPMRIGKIDSLVPNGHVHWFQ